jgi:hypothetical protein
MLEKFLTVPEGEFKKLLRSATVAEEDTDTRREAYRYAMVSDFFLNNLKAILMSCFRGP